MVRSSRTSYISFEAPAFQSSKCQCGLIIFPLSSKKICVEHEDGSKIGQLKQIGICKLIVVML
jgi:hypothetical protein